MLKFETCAEAATVFSIMDAEVHLYSDVYHKKLYGLSPQPRTIPTERPPLVGEVSANFSG
jgi:hypothetical protein